MPSTPMGAQTPPWTFGDWVMKTADSVILKGEGVSATLGLAVVLFLFSAAFTIVALVNFRFGARKATA